MISPYGGDPKPGFYHSFRFFTVILLNDCEYVSKLKWLILSKLVISRSQRGFFCGFFLSINKKAFFFCLIFLGNSFFGLYCKGYFWNGMNNLIIIREEDGDGLDWPPVGRHWRNCCIIRRFNLYSAL